MIARLLRVSLDMVSMERGGADSSILGPGHALTTKWKDNVNDRTLPVCEGSDWQVCEDDADFGQLGQIRFHRGYGQSIS